jgi:transcriptional regulator with XRE-family HTH domain
VTLGDKLKYVRQQRGWTQTELARRAGVGAALVSHLERGRTQDTRGRTVRKFARALGVSVEFLLDPATLLPRHPAVLYHPGTTIPAPKFARLHALIAAMDDDDAL